MDSDRICVEMVETGSVHTQEISQQVSRGITRLTVENGEWGFGSPNFYIISGGNGSVIIDSGMGSPEEMNLFERAWRDKRINGAIAVVVTHNHFDHDGGRKEIARLTGAPIIGGRGEMEEEKTIDLGGRIIRIFPTPGHTTDSLCALDHQTNGLFTGDTIIEDKSVVVDDMSDYVKTLEALKELAPTVIFPGHGNPIPDAPKKIQAYFDRTHTRERMILRYIARGDMDEVALVKKMYPKDEWGAGSDQISAHLQKLEKEGRVVEEDGRLRVVNK